MIWNTGVGIDSGIADILAHEDGADDYLSLGTGRRLSVAQRTLQTLSEFTAFLSSETYALPTGGVKHASSRTTRPSVAGEEFRKEIRSLRGLVLNRSVIFHTPHGLFTQKSHSRRSFAPIPITMPSPSGTSE